MFLGDFHIHSTFSDGKLTIPEIVDLYGSQNFGALAITDHFCEKESLLGKGAFWIGKTLNEATLPLYFEILKSESYRAWTQYKMILIPGIEFTRNSITSSDSAHVVVLGNEKPLDAERIINSPSETMDFLNYCKQQSWLTIAAHPVSTRRTEKSTLYLWNNIEKTSPLIDCWEVASGRVLFEPILQSSLKKIASSDLHLKEQFESWKTRFSCELNRESILKALIEGNVEFQYFIPMEKHYAHLDIS